MITFTRFNDIEQFRNIISNMNRARLMGTDDNGEPIYERNFVKPTIKFKGTVKLHGTCSSVCNHGDDVWVQSRERIITPESDNMGFAKFALERLESFTNIFNDIKSNYNVGDRVISIYGEYAGQGINNNVAINNIPKSFFIFGVSLTDTSDEIQEKEWIDFSQYRDPDNLIYNIEDYGVYEIDIDFNNPLLSQNTLVDITEKVEQECPVAKQFGHSGIGEGVCWYGYHNNKRLIFKVKGEKHSISKVKTLASVDTEKLNSINEFVEYSVTENRMDQAISIIFPDVSLSIEKMGDLIRWMVNDIHKEESDVLRDNNLSEKDVNKAISSRVRTLFNERLSNDAFGIK